MGWIRCFLSTVVVVAFFSTEVVEAQGRATEIGMDGGITFDITDRQQDNITQVNLPIQSLRVGIFVSDPISIEPSVGFALITDGDNTITQANMGLRFLYHFKEDPTKARPFLAVGPQVLFASFSGSDTVSQWSIGAELGLLNPVSENLAVRVGVGFHRRFENDDFVGSTAIFGTFGLSLFMGD